MTDGLHMQPKHRQVLEALLQEHLPGVEVWAYGSRVSGRSHDGSDLDLVLRGPGLKEIPIARLGDFEEAVRESTIPFLVEARDWTRLPERFHREIERHHVVLAMGDGRKLEGNRSGVAGDGWVSLRLGDVCTKIGSGATPRGGKEAYLQDGPYALIRSQNVYNNQFHHDGLAFIDERQAAELNNVEVFADDVLLNITGDSVARVCQVAPDVLPARVNQHVAIIRPDPNKLSPRFLRYFLVSPEIQAMLLSWAGSGGTRNALTKGMIESLDVRAPMSVIEQRAIAHILGTLDDKIELNWRMNETLEAMARALFKSWFVDFDPVRAKMAGRPSDEQAGDPGLPQSLANLFPDRLVDSELGEIPEGWEIGTVGELAERIQNGGTPKRSEPTYWERREIPWLTSAEVRQSFVLETQNFITRLGLAKSSAKMVPARSILVALYGATAGQVSMNIRPLSTNQAVSAIIPSDGNRYFCLLSLKSQVADLENRAVGSAQQNISKKTVELTILVLPPIELRLRYDAMVEELFGRIFQNLDESHTLTVLRDTLLPKLVSGELKLACRTI